MKPALGPAFTPPYNVHASLAYRSVNQSNSMSLVSVIVLEYLLYSTKKMCALCHMLSLDSWHSQQTKYRSW